MRTGLFFQRSVLGSPSIQATGLGMLLLCACGPSPDDFVGKYSVTVNETFSACTRGTPGATLLADQQSLTILEGADDSLSLELWDCSFAATIVEAGVLRVEGQSCAVSLDDATAQVEVSGDGQVSDSSSVSILLEGTYTGTDSVGYPQTCSYRLELTSPEASAARDPRP